MAPAAVKRAKTGSQAPGSPVHVFVNPDVFDHLRATGAEVVMSHEATHVATGAYTQVVTFRQHVRPLADALWSHRAVIA